MHAPLAAVLAALAALAACSGPRPAPPLGHRTEAAPPGPVLVALVTRAGGDDRLAIARVTDEQVEVVLEDDRAGVVVGWLDVRTLVAVATAPDERAVTVSRFVDARRTETLAIPAAEWPRPAFVELILVGRDEIWLSKCVFPPGSNVCADRRAYLRVSPGPRIEAAEPPARGEPLRATNDPRRSPWPLPPTAAPVPGVALSIDARRGAACARAGATSTYPPPDYGDGGFELRPRAARWVSARPPLYELAADEKNPADYVHPLRLYFRPCEPRPLDGYAFLGGDRWAELVLADAGPGGSGAAGTWTFHRGEATIGTLPGTERLRPNLP